ncbi:MAG: glycosyltransferase family 2 protein [Caulobacteraceae bacterium]
MDTAGKLEDRGEATATPLVSVIVPHYNDLAGLALCLADLGRQTFPRERFEIVVADNASPQGEAAVAAVIAGRARLVVVSERGAGPARNGGVAASRGEVLAFTDSDCRPEPGWLAAGVEALARHDFVGGRVKVLVEDAARMTPAEAFEAVFAFNNEAYVTRKGFTGSGNLFCPRALFETVGGFRTGLSEDVEWSHRARAAGYSLGYVPGAVVGHPARRSWPDLREKSRKVNTETYGLFLTRPAGRLLWLGRGLALPISAPVHVPKVLRSRALTTNRQRLNAIAMLVRVRLWRFAHAMTLPFAQEPR